ncbi:MAG: hypothetical protein IKX20_05630 [Paludibacteraceae bacterium]|nr:hypothetical protein [Paludibacteraceae bacterium]
MKKLVFSILMLVSAAACTAAPPLVYFGDTLEWNKEWTRKECGTLDIKANIKEVSGIACSRETPGYIWMESDDYESYIIATNERGAKRFMTVKFDKIIRWDWEDMSGGVYEGKNYLFIGAFGDNEETDGNYHIVWFEEPAIDLENPSITITPNSIKYVYPDGKKHNNEALMYDNREQMIYIITKVYYNVCQVFSLPFRLDYGDEVQTLTYECDLGVRSDLGESSKNQPYKGFHLVTGADISPDGKYILIKNHNNIVASYSWILLFERLDGESVGETLRREKHPGPLRCYNYEWQGEAICWLNDNIFYTTSDADDGNPPIYKYVRNGTEDINVVTGNPSPVTHKLLRDGQLLIERDGKTYNAQGAEVK